MGLGSDELERLADDIYKDRIITGWVYCGNCGYNLHSLPYAYTCPECGNEYNARPLAMKGIFAPHNTFFPTSDIAATLLCGAVTIALIISLVNRVEDWKFFVAVVFGVFTAVFALQGYRRLARYLKTRMIARHIAMEEEG